MKLIGIFAGLFLCITTIEGNGTIICPPLNGTLPVHNNNLPNDTVCGTFEVNDDYIPVCGRTKCGLCRTFRNNLQRMKYNCEHICKFELCSMADCNNGQCRRCNCSAIISEDFRKVKVCGENCSLCNTTCNDMCALYYDPVCACDLWGDCMTFSNECEMERHNCKNHLKFTENEFVFSYKGKCTMEDIRDPVPRHPKFCNFLVGSKICGKEVTPGVPKDSSDDNDPFVAPDNHLGYKY